MIIKKQTKSTLTPVEMDIGDILHFTLKNGDVGRLKLLSTGARVVSTDLKSFEKEVDGAITIYRFFCQIEVNGKLYRLEREVPTQKSFYDPWEIEGITIWFDAVSVILKVITAF